MVRNFIKRKLFTNRLAESVLIFFNSCHHFFSKFYPSNSHYPVNTMRKVSRGGLNFELDISDYQQYVIYFNLDADSSKPLLKFLPKDDGIIVDVGANIGQTTLWIAQLLQSHLSKIYAFEPIPSTYGKLKRNVGLNVFKNIVIENIAIGNENSFLNMMVDSKGNSGASSAATNTSDGIIVPVRQCTLDSYFSSFKERILFIKIDIEGFEINALQGADLVIKKHKPVLCIELSASNQEKQGYSAIALVKKIEALGYNYIVDSETLQPVNKHSMDNCHIDLLCKFV